MAQYKRYRWRELKAYDRGVRRPDQQDGPVIVTAHVPAIPRLSANQRRLIAARHHAYAYTTKEPNPFSPR